jgi:regulator of protease activity HflC (stomatin/prohibitin superfamily)
MEPGPRQQAATEPVNTNRRSGWIGPTPLVSRSAMPTNIGQSLPTLATVVLGIVVVLILLSRCINILRQYERGIVFRLGRAMKDERGPGLVFIFWPIDTIVKVSLRVVTWDVPTQDVITRDNVSLKVNAVVYFLVTDAMKAIIAVENFRYAVEQAAQTGLRSVLGEVELDDLLAERAKLNARLQAILDEQTEVWGVKVTQVQVKQVDLPQEMQRAIAAQAEAERTRRAKVIAAQGEFQAATKLAEAAAVLSREPISVTLRYLQTLIEIGTEQNTTIVFPLPLELFGVNRHALPEEQGPASAAVAEQNV